MKKILFVIAVTTLGIAETYAQKYEYKIITSVESVASPGFGRSRLIENKQAVKTANLTIQRTEGANQGDISRKDAKIDEFGETRLLNMYGLGGIKFQNIASNDAIIQAKINELSEQDWELSFIAGGMESDSGSEDAQGIFVTRYFFKRQK